MSSSSSVGMPHSLPTTKRTRPESRRRLVGIEHGPIISHVGRTKAVVPCPPEETADTLRFSALQLYKPVRSYDMHLVLGRCTWAA